MSYKEAKIRATEEGVYLPTGLGEIKRYVNKPYHYVHFTSTAVPWSQQRRKNKFEQSNSMLWGLNLFRDNLNVNY